MRKWLTIILMITLLTPVWGQQIRVTDFARKKKGLLNIHHVQTDKQKALLDFTTGEKGFTFLANGSEAAETEEGENMLTVKLPHKTRYVTIKHPDYGQYTWRVPAKYLKKKKRYKARLLATDPNKTYQLQQQWVVFNISPKNAILKMDSTVSLIRDGLTSLYLPVGTHYYTIESPVYESVKDSIVLTDTAKIQLDIILEPIYSYLTVKVNWPGGKIHVDGRPAAEHEGTSMRLNSGTHQLSLFWGNNCYYNKTFTIGPAEKKVIEIPLKELVLQPKNRLSKNHGNITMAQTKTMIIPANPLNKETQKAPVTLKVSDDDTEIWIDREHMGTGQWSGLLPEGYHQVTTRKDNIESVPVSIWIEDSFPQEIDLAVPKTSCGMVNIQSNVIGADIYINNVHAGETPCVIKDLPGGRRCQVRLSKKGYRDSNKKIIVEANSIVELNIKMKKT